uniref:COMM domain containing 10 n=1 Tax=Apteryx owenii TaxID=8824 RepID=A0A8B9Q3D8_APTOW
MIQAESSFSKEEEEKLQVAFSLEKQDLHLVLETISFILEQAVYHNLKPAALQQQLQSIHLDQDKAEAFASAWAAAGQDTIEKFRQRVLTPQKLETIGWQLNLQMSESMQAKLKSPQAVLELGVSNEDSKIGPFGPQFKCRTKTETASPSFEDFLFALYPREFKKRMVKHGSMNSFFQLFYKM